MTHSHVAAIEAREQRIAHLERRLVDRENTVSLMADELAFMAVAVVRLRQENASLSRSFRRQWESPSVVPNRLERKVF